MLLAKEKANPPLKQGRQYTCLVNKKRKKHVYALISYLK